MFLKAQRCSMPIIDEHKMHIGQDQTDSFNSPSPARRKSHRRAPSMSSIGFENWLRSSLNSDNDVAIVISPKLDE